MLYTNCNVSDRIDGVAESLLTVTALFETLPKRPGQVEVESVPDFVARLVGDPRPLEDALGDHVGVHADNTEPEDPLRPAFGELQ